MNGFEKNPNSSAPPLYWALAHGHLDVAQWLVSRGATTSATNNFGAGMLECLVVDGLLRVRTSPLNSHQSTFAGPGQPACVSFLIAAGANPFVACRIPMPTGPEMVIDRCLELAKQEATEPKTFPMPANGNQRPNPSGWRNVFVEIASNPNYRDRQNLQGDSLLHLAIRGLQIEAIQALLKQGANLNVTNQGGWTPAMELAFANDSTKDPSADSKREKEWTASDETGKRTSEDRRAQVYRLLREAGAQIDAPVAVSMGDFDELKKTASTPSKLQARTLGGWTLVHWATIGNQPAMIRELVRLGVDADQPDDEGNRPIHIALANKREACAEELVNFCAVDSTNRLGWSPLVAALATQNRSIVDRLLDRGAKLNPENPKHGSPVVAAYQLEPPALEFLDHLLKRGLRLSAAGAQGKTLLHHAVYRRDLPTVLFLVGRGLDVNVTDDAGQTALHLHAARLMADEVEVEINPPWKTQLGVSYTVFNKMIARAESNRSSSGLSRPSRASVSLLHVLLDLGANPKLKDRAGNTPLHHLTEIPPPGLYSTTDAALNHWLSNAGTDVNALNVRGETPLFRFLAAGKSTMDPFGKEFFMTHGARLDVTNADGVRLEEVLRKRYRDQAGTSDPIIRQSNRR